VDRWADDDDWLELLRESEAVEPHRGPRAEPVERADVSASPPGGAADDRLGDRPLDDLEADDFDELYDPDELAAIDAGPTVVCSSEPVTRVSQWRRRSALGAVLTGMALGLQEVFDPEEERSIVIEVDDEGLPNDLPVQMILDPDSPAGSLCIVHRSDVPPPVV